MPDDTPAAATADASAPPHHQRPPPPAQQVHHHPAHLPPPHQHPYYPPPPPPPPHHPSYSYYHHHHPYRPPPHYYPPPPPPPHSYGYHHPYHPYPPLPPPSYGQPLPPSSVPIPSSSSVPAPSSSASASVSVSVAAPAVPSYAAVHAHPYQTAPPIVPQPYHQHQHQSHTAHPYTPSSPSRTPPAPAATADSPPSASPLPLSDHSTATLSQSPIAQHPQRATSNPQSTPDPTPDSGDNASHRTLFRRMSQSSRTHALTESAGSGSGSGGSAKDSGYGGSSGADTQRSHHHHQGHKPLHPVKDLSNIDDNEERGDETAEPVTRPQTRTTRTRHRGQPVPTMPGKHHSTSNPVASVTVHGPNSTNTTNGGYVAKRSSRHHKTRQHPSSMTPLADALPSTTKKLADIPKALTPTRLAAYLRLSDTDRADASNLLKHSELVVRQHPVRARMIGFGEKDRRPIAPPPILQIHLKDASGSPIPISHTASTTLIVHAQIYSESGDQDCNLVVNPFIQPSKTAPSPDPATLSKTLVGSLVSFCQPLTNEKGETGMYFAFPDLSVRVSGRFRLRFDVFDTANPLSLNGVPAKGTILSDPFTVYHPKEFPGMTGSTSLSRCFAAQGVRIHIRGGEGKIEQETKMDVVEPESVSTPPIPSVSQTQEQPVSQPEPMDASTPQQSPSVTV